jgi:hypothetical protein
VARAVADELQKELIGVKGILEAERRVDEYIAKKGFRCDGRVRLDQQGERREEGDENHRSR